MPPSVAAFEYTRLASEREIRLLHLLPGQASDDIEIEIFIVKFDAEEPPKYEALSYVWGSTEPRRVINVRNGFHESISRRLDISPRIGFRSRKSGALPVTQNLETALKHLRWPDKRRVLWIDAICINQNDYVERSAEVVRMGIIFSGASQVVIWLGPESEDSRIAVDILQSIGHDVSFDEEERSCHARVEIDIDRLKTYSRAMIAKQQNWRAVTNLLDREWFKRLWIIQEIKLAAQAVVTIGYHKIPWPVFHAAFQWIWSCTRSPLYAEMFKGIDFHRLDFVIRKNVDLSVLNIIHSTKHSLCSDPRDRVYAVLSLLDLQSGLGIVPKYQLSPEEIYQDFTLRYIKRVAQLNILGLCTLRGQGLPSWVPNLSVPIPYHRLSWLKAAGASSHEFLASPDSSLVVRGVHTSSISHVSNRTLHGTTLPEVQTLFSVWEPKDLDTASYEFGGTMLDAFLTTLVAGYTRDALPLNRGPAPSSEDCRSFFFKCIRGQQKQGLSSDQEEYLDLLRYYLPGRTFFSTADGYFGLCPADARCGDHICVILGCDTPLILRPLTGRDGHFQLVGECYVHGLRHGEGLLGPIPPDWTVKAAPAHKDLIVYIWSHASQSSTHDDPRLGPLPGGWRRVYEDEARRRVSDPFSHTGAPHYSYFEEIATGRATWADPRLAPAALRSRGVDVREFILV